MILLLESKNAIEDHHLDIISPVSVLHGVKQSVQYVS